MKRQTVTTIEFVGKLNVTRGAVFGDKFVPMSGCMKITSDGTLDGGRYAARLFLNGSCMGCETDWILNALHAVNAVTKAYPKRDEMSFHVFFDLIPGKGFCETALEVGLAVLKALNYKEEAAKDYLRGLGIDQETQVEYRGQWMSYTQYLLLTNKVLAHTRN